MSKNHQDSRVRLSKNLSYILRHGALKEGIPIRSDGYILMNDILIHKRFKKSSLLEIEQVVKHDEKNRYTLKDEDGELWIRANQGHSMPVHLLIFVIDTYDHDKLDIA